jgi:hypothetical protein
MAPGQQSGNRPGFPFGKQFNITIRTITNPPAKPQTLRLVPGRGAKEDTLHPSRHLNENPPFWFGRHRPINQP